MEQGGGYLERKEVWKMMGGGGGGLIESGRGMGRDT